jgi:salicylate hydroxylase
MGGGIGGLTAALALRARGLKVAIFEQAVELGEISTSKTLKEAPVTNSPV